MQKLRAMVVDDEPKAVKNMQALLGYFPFVEVVGTASSAAEARQLLDRTETDLLFLDIQMPAETGFELLESLESRLFEVIFVTAYHEHAIRAFKANALDYLTKPVDIDDLELVLKKAQSRMAAQPVAQAENVARVLQAIATDGKMDKLMVPHLTGFRLIELEKIVSVEADGNYSIIHLTDFQKVVASRQLGQLEPLLPENQFLRIHKSTIINLRHVESFSSPTQEVSMADGSQLTVSRRRLEEFHARVRV